MPQRLDQPSLRHDVDPEVIYLGTWRRHQARDIVTSCNSRRTNGCRQDRGPSRATQHRRSRTIIPPAIRNARVCLGHARYSHDKVYGFFDTAGLFRCKVETSDGTIGLSPIPHDKIAYKPIFQHMGYKKVRTEVYRRLVEKLTVDHGEI